MWVLAQGSLVILLINSCFSAPPSTDDVLKALATVNAVGSDIDKVDRKFDGSTSPKRCPMALSHGTRLYGNATMDRKVNKVLQAMRILQNQNGHTLREVNHIHVLERFRREIGDTCIVADPPAECDPNTKYRSADGSCNNLDNPGWGMTLTSHERLLPNAYADNLGMPRVKGTNGEPLPNPRSISNAVHRNGDQKVELSKTLTSMSMAFGQFLDHDITLTPTISGYKDCCKEDMGEEYADHCFNIIIPEDDTDQTFFKKDHCIEFKRSSPVLCQDSQSKQPVRQQLNGITAFIDASNVYGSSSDEQRKLRTGVNGDGYLLKTTIQNGKERILDGDECFEDEQKKKICFSRAGDVRVNEVPTLTTLHFLFVKEHNRIADKLKDLYTDPNSNEIIFQETKKMVTSIIQKIVYDEFLQALLSEDTLNYYKLRTSNTYEYDKTLNPTILNSFATAAYRMGHTLIPPKMGFFNQNLKRMPNGERKTEETFHDPRMTYGAQAFQRLSYRLSGDPSPAADRILDEAVRSNLFINESEKISFDLAALNIQRGRDHGLPSYNKYRVLCGLTPLQESWNNEPMDGFVDGIKQSLIQAGSGSPDDIDLFTGGLIEQPVSGGNLGPTFECILGKQFNRLKFGDRFWFQNNKFGYNEDQIKEIQKYSFSKLLCINYKYNKIQFPNAFKLTDTLTNCNKIKDKDLDFSVFKPAVGPT